MYLRAHFHFDISRAGSLKGRDSLIAMYAICC